MTTDEILQVAWRAHLRALRGLIETMRETEQPRDRIVIHEHRLEVSEREFNARFPPEPEKP